MSARPRGRGRAPGRAIAGVTYRGPAAMLIRARGFPAVRPVALVATGVWAGPPGIGPWGSPWSPVIAATGTVRPGRRAAGIGLHHPLAETASGRNVVGRAAICGIAPPGGAVVAPVRWCGRVLVAHRPAESVGVRLVGWLAILSASTLATGGPPGRVGLPGFMPLGFAGRRRPHPDPRPHVSL